MTRVEDITPSDKTGFMVAWFGLKSVSFSCLPDSTCRDTGFYNSTASRSVLGVTGSFFWYNISTYSVSKLCFTVYYCTLLPHKKTENAVPLILLGRKASDWVLGLYHAAAAGPSSDRGRVGRRRHTWKCVGTSVSADAARLSNLTKAARTAWKYSH